MPMSGYTKLFSSIVASTIWRADNETRLVWITMLAMADKHGIVEGSIPGLADFARVSIHECERALAALSSPDHYSRSQAEEGRRIETVDGGWRLINHAKYRAKMGADERREYLKVKQAEWRAKHPKKKRVNAVSTAVNNSKPAYTPSTHAEADADTEDQILDPSVPTPLQDPDQTGTPRQSSRAALAVRPRTRTTALANSPEFDRFWQLYPKKTGKGDARHAFVKVKAAGVIDDIAAALAWQCTQVQWTREAGRYVPNPSTWLNQHRWEDEPFHPAPDLTPNTRRDTIGVANAKALADYERRVPSRPKQERPPV